MPLNHYIKPWWHDTKLMNSYKERLITRCVIDDLFQIGEEQINKVNPKETEISHLFSDEIEGVHIHPYQ